MSDWMQRKAEQVCPRSGCSNPPSETSVLCESHRIDNNRRYRAHYARRIAQRDKRSRRLLALRIQSTLALK